MTARAPTLVLLLAGLGLAWAHQERRARSEPVSNAEMASRRAHRRLLQNLTELEEAGGTYVAPGGPGSWQDGGSTGIIMIHANLMKDGKIVAWAARNHGLQEYSSAIYDPESKSYTQLYEGRCGIHDCKNAFCSGHVTTANDEVLIFGGHANDIQWFRHYSHSDQALWKTTMSSGRWYATPATLPDGRVLVVGGVADSGEAGYHADDRSLDNPTYEVYNPADSSWSGDQDGMTEQLYDAFPIHTYPHVILTPDGGVAVSAGKLLVKYDRSGPDTFTKAYSLESRPGHPWSYPQTGVGVPLPMSPPYDQMFFLAAGGTSEDRAKPGTPASDAAHLIELTGGPEASWQSVGPMPYERVMGDGVILCDGTIGFFGGATEGIAGWLNDPGTVEFKDGTSWYCPEKCSKAEGPLYEPTIFDPATGKWTEKGSLSEAMRPRLYHSVAVLLPDCTVLTSGSDVTWDQTAEIWSPPYLSLGPQPSIASSAPSSMQPGDVLTISYTSADPITRAILIRTGAVTHSISFDTRAVWLTISSDTGSQLSLQTPSSSNVLPPGMYMLSILTDQGVPSAATILSVSGNSNSTSTPASK